MLAGDINFVIKRHLVGYIEARYTCLLHLFWLNRIVSRVSKISCICVFKSCRTTPKKHINQTEITKEEKMKIK